MQIEAFLLFWSTPLLATRYTANSELELLKGYEEERAGMWIRKKRL